MKRESKLLSMCAATLPAPETLQFVGGIPKGWKLKASKEGYGYVLVRRHFMIIVK